MNAPDTTFMFPAGGWTRETARFYLDRRVEGPLDCCWIWPTAKRSDSANLNSFSVDQYLGYIERAVRCGSNLLRLPLDGRMAGLFEIRDAVPKAEQEEPGPRNWARLQRACSAWPSRGGGRLMGRDRIGRDVFLRGAPEGLRTDRKTVWRSDLFSLIQAYGQVKARTAPRIYHVANRPVMTLDSALERVSAMLGVTLEWMEIRDFLPPHASPELRRSALASSFVAALELAKRGRAELEQEGAFAPLRIRRLKESVSL